MIVAALRFVRREWRGGVKGLRVLVACLALGVAAIAASGSLRAAFQQALTQDARVLLGGDVELRQSYQPLTAQARHLLATYGTLSEVAQMRAMAHAGDNRRLVEVKAVDEAYPLAGQMSTEPAQSLTSLLAPQGDSWGAAADPHLLDMLGLRLGDQLRIGAATFVLRATVASEPDRVANALAFGPRLLISRQALVATGLIQPGSLIRWGTRLKLAPGINPATVKADMAQAFPAAPWEWRDLTEAAPGLDRVLDNLSAFLTLVGLTTLLVGGIGVANAVKAFLDGKLAHVAILKALGAPLRQIALVYGLLIAAMAVAGTAIGLAVGAATPWAVVAVVGDSLPVAARTGLHLQPLAIAALFGALTTVCFAWWPLAQAVAIPATALFRRTVDATKRPIGAMVATVPALAALALAACAVLSASRPLLAAAFVAAILGLLVLFRLLAAALARLAALATRRRHGMLARPIARLALANLHRPGSAVVSMVLSLGLGLTVLIAIALIEGNLARQFGETLPARAPSFFFIDVQPDQTERFTTLVHQAAPDADIEMAPMVRGRITHVRGQAVDSVAVAAEAQWALRGDRGLTAAATKPVHSRLVAGQWWPADYAGPPLVSLDAGLAKGMGVTVGDSLGVNVLGRQLTLTIANLRQVEWASLNMNFALILSPNALAGAPVTHIATVHAAADTDSRIERTVTDTLLNVSAIRVKEAIEQVRAIIAKADLAVRIAGLVTLVAGALVLAGAVMAGHRRRLREAVILKVLGATRAELWRAWLLEFGLIGIVTGVVATLAGSAAAWTILVQVMRADWTFLPGLTLATLGLSLATALAAGFASAFLALRTKAAPVLRQE